MTDSGASSRPPIDRPLPGPARPPHRSAPGPRPGPVAPSGGLSPVARAREFVRRTARVLEQRRFAHHFPAPCDPQDTARGARADAVETALAAYGNEDGGFGHGLDPGLRGPGSSPLHTVYALEVLDSIGRCEGRRVERLGGYLTSVSAPDGALPALAANAPRHPGSCGELLVAGPVVGLLHRNDVWHTWLFRATDFCWQAVEALHAPRPREIEAAVRFLDHAPDRTRAWDAADRLGRMVRERRLVVLDGRRPLGGGTQGGARFPYHYARTPQSLAAAWFTDAEMARSLDQLAARQQHDGGWQVAPGADGAAGAAGRRWAPGAAQECLERRPVATIEALRTLCAFGRHIG
ncbi:hypothetical protein [Streptomyces sp. NPDC050560]|uniref:hypothetical protein n=1 Tax=Streptomyces sp. NPDC050560 TaxID=3365630 RepID=UPI0037A6D7D8